MADQIRDTDKDQSKKNTQPLDEKDLDQVSGGAGGGGAAIKIDLGPHGGEAGPHGNA